MMKFVYRWLLVSALCGTISAQENAALKTIVETEKAFARTAAEKDTKTAFLEFLADDGITFDPNPGNGKEAWKARPSSPAFLAWTPEYADISANGVLGYTTGPWEYRPKGKADQSVAFGHFVTLWQKQLDGKYRFVLDLGITHAKVDLVDKWATAQPSPAAPDAKRTSAADASVYFFELAEKEGLAKAYKSFSAGDIRLYREGKLPFIGKNSAIEAVKKEKSRIKFSRRSIFFSAGDLAYITNGYSVLDNDGKDAEKGNFLQIWKYRGEKWMIVLDLFKTLPTGN